MNRELKIPKQISPCPIIEGLIELRFETIVPSEAILGIAYSVLKNDFGEIENLPILQIPEQIRKTDPKLQYQTWYKLSKGNFSIQIGPKVISFINHTEYLGWEIFFSEISKYFTDLNNIHLFDKFFRVGLRYINHFPQDIFPLSTISLKLNNKEIETNRMNVGMEIRHGDLVSRVNMYNESQVVQFDQTKYGSVIDIDTYSDKKFEFAEALPLINKCHNEEKLIFYNLLSEEFIRTLNPNY